MPILFERQSVKSRYCCLLRWRYRKRSELAGRAYSVIDPDVVILPILLVPNSANHRFPSGPVVIMYGLLPAGSAYSVTDPDVVILPILLLLVTLVNHRLLSGPTVIPNGPLPAGNPYSVTVPLVVTLLILFVP